MNPRTSVTIALSLLLAGCGKKSVTVCPTREEVAGRYLLSSSKFGGSVDSEIRSKAKDAYIELYTNGTVILHKVPMVPESSSRTFGIDEFRSASNTFAIAALGSNGKVDFYGIYVGTNNLTDPMQHPTFRRKGRALCLCFDYFDGDFTERMVFTRKE